MTSSRESADSHDVLFLLAAAWLIYRPTFRLSADTWIQDLP